eukprot:g61582.t1
MRNGAFLRIKIWAGQPIPIFYSPFSFVPRCPKNSMLRRVEKGARFACGDQRGEDMLFQDVHNYKIYTNE